MNKIVKMHRDELIIDRQKSSDIINQACNGHQHKMKVTGCCPINELLLIALEEREDDSEPVLEYVFAPFPSMAEEDLVSEIQTRYCAGFSTICGFKVKENTMWGLFALDKNARKPDGKQD